MSSALYNKDILRLAADIPHHQRLSDPMASVEKRSPTCGSRVTADVILEDGRLSALGLEVRACALGQASASLFAAEALGKSVSELTDARDRVAAFLAGEQEEEPWPGFALLAPAVAYRARHPSIRLVFESVSEAAQAASAKVRA